MSRNYDGLTHNINAPADDWVAITPSDITPLADRPRAIHVAGTAGIVTVQSAAGNSMGMYFAQGQTQSIRPLYIMATGTTATSIYALY